MSALAPLARGLFEAQLLDVLRSPDFRKACIQRLVAATIDAIDGFRVVDFAIERVRDEARGPVPHLAGRILRAIDASCADYAEIRGHPYKRLVGPVTRAWETLMSLAGQAGLSEEEGYAVMRDLLRKRARDWTRWQGKDLERELIEALRFGFSIVGITKGMGIGPMRS